MPTWVVNSQLTISLQPPQVLPKRLRKHAPSSALSEQEWTKEFHKCAQLEFKILQKTTRPKRCMFRIATSFPACLKNRYRDVLANDDSRIVLQDGSYVNANRIAFEGPAGAKLPEFIACQAPLRSTFIDFWCMVVEQQSGCIVMLTDLKEGTKSKADRYWPTAEQKTLKFRDLAVSFKCSNSPADGLCVTTLQVQRGDETPRDIYHIHFVGWKDHDVPEKNASLCSLVNLATLYREKAAQAGLRGPVTTHCSAGIGRTGCFIALSVSIRLCELDVKPDILRIVEQMRQQRSGMVQTCSQYLLLYSSVNSFLDQHSQSRYIGRPGRSVSVYNVPDMPTRIRRSNSFDAGAVDSIK